MTYKAARPTYCFLITSIYLFETQRRKWNFRSIAQYLLGYGISPFP